MATPHYCKMDRYSVRPGKTCQGLLFLSNPKRPSLGEVRWVNTESLELCGEGLSRFCWAYVPIFLSHLPIQMGIKIRRNVPLGCHTHPSWEGEENPSAWWWVKSSISRAGSEKSWGEKDLFCSYYLNIFPSPYWHSRSSSNVPFHFMLVSHLLSPLFIKSSFAFSSFSWCQSRCKLLQASHPPLLRNREE